MKKIILFFLPLLMLAGCMKETMEPGTQVSGNFTEDDGTGQSGYYISFSDGRYCRYVSSEGAYTFMENAFWAANGFVEAKKSGYSIRDGRLYVGDKDYGKISLSNGCLTIGNNKYETVEAFREENYSSISLPQGTTAVVDYTAQTLVYPYSVERPIPSGKVSIKANLQNWIRNCSLSDGNITFQIEDNNSGRIRSGDIALFYPGAKDVVFTLTQQYAQASIDLTPSSKDVDYTGGSFSFDFSVRNPREGTTVTAQSQNVWITDVTIEGNTVKYKVTENNSRSSRNGTICLSYGGGLATKDFAISQSYTASVITLTPSSQDVDYTGGLFSFEYSVSNPREGATVTAQSQNEWISDVSVFGNQVSYRVSENRTVSERTGSIVLQYYAGGNVCGSASFQIEQSLGSFDLSASETANCYVVSDAGSYKLKAVKGNSNISVGTVSSAEVLWESFGTNVQPNIGDVIATSQYDSNYIYFSTPANLKSGNAVIAAKDADGTILWSWHIWVCSGYNSANSAQTYYNSVGKMMDRNLGATSAMPGNVGALGLLYQWGRKDPFIGSSRISSSTKATSTLSWPTPVASDESNGTIAYAVAHPTTLITYNRSNYDWNYTGSSSTDNTRWQSSKTIYDPCPPGWRVPDGGKNGVWSKACGRSSSISGYPFDDTNNGMNFSGKFGTSGSIWYPAAGYLYADNGSLNYVGSYGRWWSCTPIDYYAYSLCLIINGDVYPSDSYSRAYGLSVRCLQE